MSIIKWDPYKTMKQVQESIDSVFETSLVKSKYSEDEIVHCEWVPNVDIFDDEEKVVIKIDLPEVDDSDIKIRYDNDMLILKGERKFMPESKIEDYKRIERPYGTFLRKFAVPSGIDINGIKAATSAGVLRITLPKIKENGPEDLAGSPTENTDNSDTD